MKVALISVNGEKTAGQVNLTEEIFGGKVNEDLVAQYMRVSSANLRQGTAATKGRGAVRGGGRKPWRQKGTGRARQGSIRSPLWVGGGVAHGPHPKDWSLKLPAKMKRRALLSVLADKACSNMIFVVKSFSEKWEKTKDLNMALKNWKINRPILLVLGKEEKSLGRLGRNLSFLEILPVSSVNASAILRARSLLFSQDGLKELEDLLLKKGEK